MHVPHCWSSGGVDGDGGDGALSESGGGGEGGQLPDICHTQQPPALLGQTSAELPPPTGSVPPPHVIEMQCSRLFAWSHSGLGLGCTELGSVTHV